MPTTLPRQSALSTLVRWPGVQALGPGAAPRRSLRGLLRGPGRAALRCKLARRACTGRQAQQLLFHFWGWARPRLNAGRPVLRHALRAFAAPPAVVHRAGGLSQARWHKHFLGLGPLCVIERVRWPRRAIGGHVVGCMRRTGDGGRRRGGCGVAGFLVSAPRAQPAQDNDGCAVQNAAARRQR